MDQATSRFLQRLVKKRETYALGLIEQRHTAEKYFEVHARCLELEEVIAEARAVFKGEDDDGDSDKH